MIKENKAEFEKTNLLNWHDAGYKGKGITVVVLDDRGIPYEWTYAEMPFPEEHRTSGDHNMNVCSVVREVAPECRIVSMPWMGGIKKEIIDWIIKHKEEVDIVNCSFAGSIGIDEFNRLKDLDIPVVCASGNSGNKEKIAKPAVYDWTIAIGAKSEASGKVASYSQGGEQLDAVSYTSIYILNSKKNPFPFPGTSCSAPMTSGMLACYLSWRKENKLPRLGREEIRKFIHDNSKDMYEEGHDYKSGYGLFQLPSKIQIVEIEPIQEPPVVIDPTPEQPPKPIEEVKDLIIDISHHQIPANIDYDKLAKQVKWAIIRTQYGSLTIDKHYKTHHDEFRKRGVPTAAYAWVRGISIKDMEIEATDFYNRTKDINPTFWFLDVEEQSMTDMRAGIKAYVNKLRERGAVKVGAYIGHHLYRLFNLDVTDFDAVWIPHYGVNNGTINSKPSFPCDIHQFTSTGRLDGYNGNLDLNRLMGTKPLSYFIGEEETEIIVEPLKDIKLNLHGKDLIVKGIFNNNTNYIPVRFLEQLGYKIEYIDRVVKIEYAPPKDALD